LRRSFSQLNWPKEYLDRITLLSCGMQGWFWPNLLAIQ